MSENQSVLDPPPIAREDRKPSRCCGFGRRRVIRNRYA